MFPKTVETYTLDPKPLKKNNLFGEKRKTIYTSRLEPGMLASTAAVLPTDHEPLKPTDQLAPQMSLYSDSYK